MKNLWIYVNNGLRLRNENELPELLLVCKILFILSTHYENFRVSWMLLTKDNAKTLDELVVQLCTRTFDRNSMSSSTATERKEKVEALVVGHRISSDKNKFRRKGNCHYCGNENHWIRECAKWIRDGEPPRKKEEPKNSVNNVADESNIALTSSCNELNNVLTVETNEKDWWIRQWCD